MAHLSLDSVNSQHRGHVHTLLNDCPGLRGFGAVIMDSERQGILALQSMGLQRVRHDLETKQ